MEIASRFVLGDLMMNGTSGYIGKSWLQLPLDSEGDKLYDVTLLNAVLTTKINIDAEAACQDRRRARITELNLPLLYDGVSTKFENLDQVFETVIEGIMIFILESQNMDLETALQSFLSTSIGMLCVLRIEY